MFLSGLIVLGIALLLKVRGSSRITIALYAFWISPLAIRLVLLFLSIICIVLLSAFVDPMFCDGEGSDNNGGITPTHISTSISNKSVSDTPISLNLNFTTTLKGGVTAAGLGYGIAKVVKAAFGLGLRALRPTGKASPSI